MAFLYEKIDALREYGSCAPVPDYIPQNLNPGFELRPYQVQAFENFITHFESRNCPKPTQVLFHMATGSGKTLMMAGLMLYLYQKGYRNFLFFVNLSNIVEKPGRISPTRLRPNTCLPGTWSWTAAMSPSGRWKISRMPVRTPSTSALPPPRDSMRICGRPRKMPCPLRISRPIKRC